MQKKQEIGIVKKQDISENLVKTVYLGIGSNLGNRKIHLEKAKYLIKNKNIHIIKCSSFYETLSWPNKSFPKYLNIVIKIKTKLTIFKLFQEIKLIETLIGRTKNLKNYPRVCDIDILDYDQKIKEINSKSYKILVPHPRLHERNFVLLPFFEIEKNWIHPKLRQNIKILLSKVKTSDLTSVKLA